MLISKSEVLVFLWDSLCVQESGFYVLNCVTSLNIKDGDSAGEKLHKHLHAIILVPNKVKGCLILNFIVRKCKAVFQLLISKEEALLVWWNSFHFWKYGF